MREQTRPQSSSASVDASARARSSRSIEQRTRAQKAAPRRAGRALASRGLAVAAAVAAVGTQLVAFLLIVTAENAHVARAFALIIANLFLHFFGRRST